MERDRASSSNTIVKVLIYRLGSLGDSLLALPCFRALRTKFPQAHISLLTNIPVSHKASPIMDILAHTGVVDEVLEYPLKLRNPSAIFTLAYDLRKRNFDIAVHLAAARGRGPSIRDLAFFKLVGAKRVVGVPFAREDLYPTEVREGVWEWEAVRLARRIRPLVRVNLLDPAAWDLALTVEEETAATGHLCRKKFPDRRWIAASVGTKSNVNDWTENNWITLIRSLKAEYANMGLVMLGSDADFVRSERCLTEWSGECLNLCGKVSSRISAAVLQQTELFVGHDSGPMHLAAVVGTPCVAIFSARNFPGQWFPKWLERNRVLYHRTECFGCGWEVCTDYAKKCILSITVREVKEAIQSILEKSEIAHHEVTQ